MINITKRKDFLRLLYQSLLLTIRPWLKLAEKKESSWKRIKKSEYKFYELNHAAHLSFPNLIALVSLVATLLIAICHTHDLIHDFEPLANTVLGSSWPPKWVSTMRIWFYYFDGGRPKEQLCNSSSQNLLL